jgi:hypothetical protein
LDEKKQEAINKGKVFHFINKRLLFMLAPELRLLKPVKLATPGPDMAKLRSLNIYPKQQIYCLYN